MEGFLQLENEFNTPHIPSSPSSLSQLSSGGGDSYCFLLSDILIISAYSPRDLNNLFKFIEMHLLSSIERLVDVPDEENKFYIYFCDPATAPRLFSTRSPSEKQKWFNAISTCISGQLIQSEDELSDLDLNYSDGEADDLDFSSELSDD